jgi:hypothetical protein
VLLRTLLCVMKTGTSLPVVISFGTWALTWYTPTKPGAIPAKVTVACWPPMLTLGSVFTTAGGELGPGWPDATAGSVGPSPVQKIEM